MLRRHSVYLQGCTLLFTVTLFWWAARSLTLHPYDDGHQGALERNERSTPRSFILPATPAVAEEQENQLRELKTGVNSLICLQRLKALGYDADDTPPVFTARNVGAIAQFQKDRGLLKTGRFDWDTAGLLSCQ
jgi:hypothetical protein